MTIFPAITALSSPTDDEPISRGKIAYLCARYRGNVHSLVLEEFSVVELPTLASHVVCAWTRGNFQSSWAAQATCHSTQFACCCSR